MTVPMAGGKTTGVVLCNDAKTIDIKARGGRKIETADPVIVEQVLWKVQAIVAD